MGFYWQQQFIIGENNAGFINDTEIKFPDTVLFIPLSVREFLKFFFSCFIFSCTSLFIVSFVESLMGYHAFPHSWVVLNILYVTHYSAFPFFIYKNLISSLRPQLCIFCCLSSMAGGRIWHIYFGIIWCRILFKTLMIEINICTTFQSLTS